MSNPLQEMLATRRWLLADGATGTQLFEAGLQTGEAPEAWNLEYPQRVLSHHESFVVAGSDIVLSNSFGGNRFRLALHGAAGQVAVINRAAARLARRAADAAGRRVLVAGSMGPTGEILEPLGALAFEAARDAFAEQARGLAEGGVDLLWIETMSAAEEVRAAVAGAAETGLPVVCTMSFDSNGRTMMGVTPAEAGRSLAVESGPVACGANCGVGAAELVLSVLNMRGAIDAARPVVAKANAGIPAWVDGRIVYDGTPALMAEFACVALDAGARIIGGCCGTTPAHVAAMRAALENHTPGPVPDLDAVVARLGPVSTGAAAQARGALDAMAGAVGGPRAARTGRRRKRS